MQSVAHHLQLQAVKIASIADAEPFARSAFNRYYYATFLCVRNALAQIDPSYGHSLNHKQIPEMLCGSIHRRIKDIRKRASKLDDADLVKNCDMASRENLAFAEVLRTAYAIRVVADYEPQISVSFEHSRFKLQSVSITDAHGWFEHASVWSSAVLDVIRQENA